jgi:hypothetical protein
VVCRYWSWQLQSEIHRGQWQRIYLPHALVVIRQLSNRLNPDEVLTKYKSTHDEHNTGVCKRRERTYGNLARCRFNTNFIAATIALFPSHWGHRGHHNILDGTNENVMYHKTHVELSWALQSWESTLKSQLICSKSEKRRAKQ